MSLLLEHESAPHELELAGAVTDHEGVDMAHITASSNDRTSAQFHRRDNEAPMSVKGASLEAGEVLYAVLTDDMLIKIGWTSNFYNRTRFYRNRRVMAMMPGTRDEEAEIHERLKPYRGRGFEYYRRVQPVLDEVNRMRAWGGLEPLSFAQKNAA